MTPIPFRTPQLLGDLQRRYGGELDAGLAERVVNGITLPAHSAADELALLVAARSAAGVEAGRGPVLVSSALAPLVAQGRRWVHPAPWWPMSFLLEDTVPAWSRQSGASISPDVARAPSAIVNAGAVIGPECRLEPHCVIYAGVVLGARVSIGSGSVIGRPGFGFAHGPGGAARRIPQMGGVVVGDDVEIGALCTVDAGTLSPTEIGAHSKLDAQVHVGHNVRIAESCFIAAQVGLAGSVEIGHGVWIGGQAGVADHVRIGAGARIAAKSGVISDVPPNATVAGYPAVLRARWLRSMAELLRPRRRRRP